MLYTTILCATDGFEHSDRAVRHAGQLTAETGAELHVVHIAESPLANAVMGGEYIRLSPAERRMRITTQIAQLARDRGLRINRHFMFQATGSVAVRIARLADELAADLIVVGSRGRAPVSAALIGSEAQRLPHVTMRPILVVTGDPVRHATRGRTARVPRRPQAVPAITVARLGSRR